TCRNRCSSAGCNCGGLTADCRRRIVCNTVIHVKCRVGPISRETCSLRFARPSASAYGAGSLIPAWKTSVATKAREVLRELFGGRIDLKPEGEGGPVGRVLLAALSGTSDRGSGGSILNWKPLKIKEIQVR